MTNTKQTTMSRSRLWTALGLWGPPAVLFVVIFALSSTPGNRFPEHPEIFNIVSHFVEFALLAFLLARALATVNGKNPWLLLIVTVSLCVILGFMDELLQFTVPQRMFDLMDLFYDLLGAFTGTLLFLGWRKKPLTGQMESGDVT